MNTDRTRDRRQTQRAAGSGCVVMSNSRSYQCLSVFICGSDESFAFWLRAWSLIGRNRSRGSVCRGDSTLPTGEIASNLNHQDTETPRGMICENRAYDCLTGLHSLCLGALVVQLVNSYPRRNHSGFEQRGNRVNGGRPAPSVSSVASLFNDLSLERFVNGYFYRKQPRRC